MGLPNINIIFRETAGTAIQRGSRGIVALILKDSVHNGLNTYISIDDVPTDFSAYNKKQMQDAFIGNVNAPIKVIVYVLPTAATDYTDAHTALEAVKWNYLAVPGISSEDAATMAIYIKGLKDNKRKRVTAILPHTAGDHEAIINFDTDDIIVGSNTYDATDYCARIAGLIAGTPLNQSATFSVLPEVNDVPHLTDEQFDTAIDAGKFVLMNDGSKCKVSRSVNSLVTTNATKTADWKKIKIVDIQNQTKDDIEKTIADNYTGKFPNDYDNQVILIGAILGYARTLEDESLYAKDYSHFEVNISAKKTYLQSIGIDIENMKDQEVKEYPTGSKVFLSGGVKILDAMEDFDIVINS